MADAKTAIEFVLRQEDSTLSGKITEDSGGRTRFGIAERWHPELSGSGFYECTAGLALMKARFLYQSEYWVPIRGDGISSQDFANRLLSFAVNEGIHESFELLQRALQDLGTALEPDGVPGPHTIAALNVATAKDEPALMSAWRARLATFYEDLAARNPADGKYLKGWLNRVAQ